MEQKDNSQELHILSHLGKGDQFVFYVFKKSSRISYAVYIITDLIKDNEPLKWSLRKVANELASVRGFFDGRSVFNGIERNLMELESLLELASFAKVLSFMNVSLLKGEIQRLINEMKERGGDGFYTHALVSSFFDVPRAERIDTARESFIPDKQGTADIYKGHKGHANADDFYKKSPLEKVAMNTYDTSIKKISVPKLQTNSTEIDKSKRQSKIIDIIKASKAEFVSIKDITSRIKDCSEKTIQRELISMVESGILKKTGERRWSMYALKG